MSFPSTVISPPIPPYQNLPIEPQWYKPRRYIITAIQEGPTTIVTTDYDNFYVIGQEVRLIIQTGNGCRQLNGRTGFVISLPSTNSVEIDINSLGMDPFVISTQKTQPQILAIGDVNTGHINPFGRCYTFPWIPGTFQNISPNPFNREFDFL